MALPTSESSNNDKIDPAAIAVSQAEISALEADLAEVSELADKNPALLGGEDVATLLERLSNVENMADGVEDKLDNVLKNLDTLLSTLDGAGSQQPPVEADKAANEPKESSREAGSDQQ